MKPRLFLFAAMTVCLGIAACSEKTAPPAQTLGLPTESKASAEGTALVAQKWPALRAACPGLDKFSIALQPAAVDDNFSYAPQHAQRATVSYRVADGDTTIPAAFGASGHTCSFEISRDGSEGIVSKSACQAVCLDRKVEPSELQNGNLRLALK